MVGIDKTNLVYAKCFSTVEFCKLFWSLLFVYQIRQSKPENVPSKIWPSECK